MVQLASSSGCLQFALERFAAVREVVGIRISTSRSDAMVLSWKRVKHPLRLSDELLPQVEEFKYLRILLMSEWRGEWED